MNPCSYPHPTLRLLLLAPLAALPLSAQVTQWDVFLTERLTQTSTAPVTAADAYAWDYSSRLVTSSPDDLANGTATRPGGAVLPLDLAVVYGGFSYLYGRVEHADRSALLADTTPGTYTFDGSGGTYDGFQASLDVPPLEALTFASVLPSFSSETIEALAAGWLPANNFTFAWSFWQTPVSPDDPSLIFFRISQGGAVVYDSGGLSTDIAGINSPWTSYVAPGTPTTIEVYFSARSLTSVDLPPGSALVGYDLATSYQFTTAGTAIPEPAIVSAALGLAALAAVAFRRRRSRA